MLTEPGSYTFTFIHFADTFIQSDLQLGIHKAILLKEAKADTGSARNSKFQALFK